MQQRRGQAGGNLRPGQEGIESGLNTMCWQDHELPSPKNGFNPALVLTGSGTQGSHSSLPESPLPQLKNEDDTTYVPGGVSGKMQDVHLNVNFRKITIF